MDAGGPHKMGPRAVVCPPLIYKEVQDQRRKFLKDLAKQLCMPSVEARSTNRMVMRNRFLRAAVEMVLGRHTTTPPERTAMEVVELHRLLAAAMSAETCNENDVKAGKAAWHAFNLFATNTQWQKQNVNTCETNENPLD
ncbi:unnamed protein product [Clavelina lepadiformis]|uniref:Uncharacterized protein n=1 Tax=Clavelina lepadiformis TaxID=159417 RepID=A0ABP0GD74_CLALP